MLTILSPAKNMRESSLDGLTVSRPCFLNRAEKLVEELKGYSPWQLEGPLALSPELAIKAHCFYQAWDKQATGSPAILTYRGLQFTHLEPESFTLCDHEFANGHLRILSALYGLLLPADGISPYRLELQSKVKIQGMNLYAFWGDSIKKELFRTENPVINLASGEYSRAVMRHLGPGERVITCDFLTTRGSKRRVIPTEAKMARGRMAQFIVKHRIDNPQHLRDFDWDGYAFVEKLSSDEDRKSVV